MSAAFAVVGAGFSWMAIASDLVALGAGITLVVAAIALVAAPDRDGPHGIEAATKGIVGTGLVLVLLSLAIVFTWAAAGDTHMSALGRALVAQPQLAVVAVALVVVVLALILGAVPLHQTFVDVTHGASAASSSLLAGGALIAGGAATLRVVDGLALAGADSQLTTALSVLAGITLIGAPIASLNQTRIGRVVAYLVVVPGGLVFASAAAGVANPTHVVEAWRAGTSAALAGALGAAAALLGVVLPRLDASSTWEDWAGFGRKRPVMSALLVYALGTVAGVPGTLGFDARLDVAKACIDVHLDVMGLIVVGSAAAGAAPLVRLALFLFAKEPPQRQRIERPEPSGQLLVIAFGILVVGSAVLAIAPWMLGNLVAAADAAERMTRGVPPLMRTMRITANLRVADVDAAKSFYAGYLGLEPRNSTWDGWLVTRRPIPVRSCSS